MRVLNKEILSAFCKKHSEMRVSIQTWLTVVEKAKWKTPHDVQNDYPKASKMGSKYWWFDINPGGYRLKIIINYKTGQILINRICAHGEYKRLIGKEKKRKYPKGE